MRGSFSVVALRGLRFMAALYQPGKEAPSARGCRKGREADSYTQHCPHDRHQHRRSTAQGAAMPGPFVPSDDQHRSYHSGATGRLVRRPEAVLLAKRLAPRVSFTFETGKYRPPFTVTVRTSVDNWTQDHTGTFRDGRWEFTL